MADKLREYESEKVKVTWSQTRCIHFKACVKGLPDVFDIDQKPWIQPGEAEAERVMAVVQCCPTGALHAEYADGTSPETAPETNTIRVAQDGPLYVHADVKLKTPDGELILEDTRVALCRCGASEHKPYCDGSHADVDFEDTGALAQNQLKDLQDAAGALTITPSKDGPFLLDGPVVLESAGGLTHYEGRGGALCRCGHSSHKPFCDGSHKEAGFSSGE